MSGKIVIRFHLNTKSMELLLHQPTTRVFRNYSPGKIAQWLARSIHESWGVLWLVIRLLSVQAYVSSSVIKAFFLVLHSPPHLSHAGALPATTYTSPTPRRRTVTSKYSSFTWLQYKHDLWGCFSHAYLQISKAPIICFIKWRRWNVQASGLVGLVVISHKAGFMSDVTNMYGSIHRNINVTFDFSEQLY
jgi:hypothetical protein